MEETKKKFLQGTWLNIVLGALIIIAGIVVIAVALSKPDVIANLIAIIMAVALFLMGALALTTSLVIYHGIRIHSSIIYGSAMIGAGVVLVIMKDTIVVNIIRFLAVFLISFGAAELINAIIMTAQKKLNEIKTVWIVLFYALAAATVALGTVVLVFNEKNSLDFQKIIYVIVGICIIASGILEIVAEILKVRSKRIENKEKVTVSNDSKQTTVVIETPTTTKPVEEEPSSEVSDEKAE